MTFLIIAAAVCGIDQLTKLITTTNLDLHETIDVIPKVLQFTRYENTGAAFSMFSKHTWALALLSVIVSIALTVVIIKWKVPFWEKVSLSVVLGGALGNAIDRVLLGYVVDMIIFVPTGLSIFNVADIFIDCGAIAFCILYMIRNFKEEKAKKTSKQKNIPQPDSGDSSENENGGE